MKYLIAALIGGQLGINITVYWVVYKLGQHEAALTKNGGDNHD